MSKVIINDALKFVRNTFDDDYSGRDYFHAVRVYKMATRIAEQENANLIIVQLAALPRDLDDIKLSPETYVNKHRVVDFLRKGGRGPIFVPSCPVRDRGKSEILKGDINRGRTGIYFTVKAQGEVKYGYLLCVYVCLERL